MEKKKEAKYMYGTRYTKAICYETELRELIYGGWNILLTGDCSIFTRSMYTGWLVGNEIYGHSLWMGE